MSHERFTKGPWSVVDNSWEVSTVYGPDGETVAECPINSTVLEDTQHIWEPIKEANTRLIAAAPELLASVIELLEPLERASAELVSRGKVADENAEAAFDRARAAIAKATGQTNMSHEMGDK